MSIFRRTSKADRQAAHSAAYVAGGGSRQVDEDVRRTAAQIAHQHQVAEAARAELRRGN